MTDRKKRRLLAVTGLFLLTTMLFVVWLWHWCGSGLVHSLLKGENPVALALTIQHMAGSGQEIAPVDAKKRCWIAAASPRTEAHLLRTMAAFGWQENPDARMGAMRFFQRRNEQLRLREGVYSSRYRTYYLNRSP